MNDAITSLPEAPPQIESSDSTTPVQRVTGFQRVADAMRLALQLGERLLPPPYGHIASTASHLMKPRPNAPPLPPPVNLAPIQDGLAKLQAEHNDLCGQVLEQSASLKRVEEQLERVSEATKRNTVAQQGLMEELKSMGNRVETLKATVRKAKVFAMVLMGLLVVTIALNLILLLRFHR